jgi:prepilin-type N-terminal cleavage/methylation domain-containing protein
MKLKIRRPDFAKNGFTLIELLFAMAFLSILLFVIALLIVHVTTIYQKGLAMRAISQTGRELIDDISRSVSAAAILEVMDERYDFNGNGVLSESEYILASRRYYFQSYDSHTVRGENAAQRPSFGAFCTGTYTYLWNTAYALNDNNHLATFIYKNDSNVDVRVQNFKLLKLTDPGREICAQAVVDITNPTAENLALSGNSDFRVNNYIKTPPIVLLDRDETDLAVYDFKVFPISQNQITGHAFYSSSFIIATLRGGVDILSNGNFCSDDASDHLNTDFSYCAVNKFNFSMRATGDVGFDREDEYGSR